MRCRREGSAQDRKAQNTCLFLQITENLVVLYSDHVKLTRYTTRFPTLILMAATKGRREGKVIEHLHIHSVAPIFGTAR